ncbi:MAG TPA: acetyl-CoA carboxylase biotin carboxylase subunit [Longimicrobiales bacterium]|nr:acetyl-CoA carboxylase biotin carboxylase subunit [Longimicrobiales bacterium]
MLKKVLVANRGEIALRVIRACHELGIEAVAVCSEADRRAAHVLAAGEAVVLGPAPAAESYLRVDRLLEAARSRGCDAVHPGYGFLAERAAFAAAVEEAGLVFVGPSSSAIEAMGDKTRARQAMMAAGVPVVPGTVEALADAAAAERTAAEIGYPVMLKAAAGGGGKGMRVVREPGDLVSAFDAASREATAAFGDGSVYLERYLDGPRHIEIQVLADGRGNTIHLGERECSIQRRHQKMIEEAPSPVVTPELRRDMGEAAVAAAEAVGYRNAGTVEFLFQAGEFFFLEMNTRIQVEHPVTELVTGLDLVQWQLRIAAGEPLSVRQEEVRWDGHAIECRITSEDPRHGFLPSTGRIELLQIPAGPGVRWDGGIQEGDEVSLHYDPLLGKLVAHAPTRALAIARMARALSELRVVGVETSAPFHARVLAEEDFRAGRLDIRYLERHPDLATAPAPDGAVRAAALAAAFLAEEDRARRSVRRVEGSAPPRSRWRDAGWR